METNLQSTSYLGPIQFFVQIAKSYNVTIETQEHYNKQTYRNRCQIYGANGLLNLSIPIQKTGTSHSKIKDVKINYADRWQKIHWKSFESAYRRSPYFEFYEHKFEKYFNNQKHTFLFDYNLDIFTTVLELLDLSQTINFTEEFIKEPANTFDLRNKDPKKNKELSYSRYIQVFEDKAGFIPNLSIVDLLFNEGPNSKSYLLEQV